ncbi:tRNA lysidine(34) synthetase TilS [Mycoavidus sp. B2-EB]|uniref:tRNA lysidine(34) synthetase TilS n=1 Tax=Mycoavidus sp. B2-EB TaxID=2651972 RepID=UPI001E5FF1FF|nr:tRNA lysidine(34) synthetase TilS [Mycoavidus sp. B2-EB]BBO59759.1 tRNA(Ile)-lysidine synthase [Mycoavidus sp. B2-EB]
MAPPSIQATEVKRVAEALHAALQPLYVQQTLAIALSGGLDSTVLLHAAMASVGAEHCIALHIHHGLSPHADAWLAHCQAYAAQLGVRFAARQITIEMKSGHGLEAAARDARYAALNQLCQAQAAQLLLLGHHADDQAETVLLQLLRGTGIAGLAAMPTLKKAKKITQTEPLASASNLTSNELTYLRPLLGIPRQALQTYAKEYNLRWLEDESNTDLRYTRNALRHTLLPQIGAHFPAYRTTLARAAQHAADAQTLLDELAKLDLQRVAVPPNASVLSRAALITLNTEQALRAINLIRYWLRRLNLPAPSNARLENILKQLCTARADATLQIDHAGHRLRMYRDKIWWDRVERPHDPLCAADASASHAALRSDAPEPSLCWSGPTAWGLPQWRGTLLFTATHNCDPAGVPTSLLRLAPLRAAPRQGGERMRKAPQGPRRTLKNLFQEAGIPAWQRNTPCIYVGDRLLFVPYLGLNYELSQLIDPAVTERVRLEWRVSE